MYSQLKSRPRNFMSASELEPNQNSLDTTRFVLLKKRGISQHARSSTYFTRVLLALRAIRHVIDKVSLHWSTEVVLFYFVLTHKQKLTPKWRTPEKKKTICVLRQTWCYSFARPPSRISGRPHHLFLSRPRLMIILGHELLPVSFSLPLKAFALTNGKMNAMTWQPSFPLTK